MPGPQCCTETATLSGRRDAHGHRSPLGEIPDRIVEQVDDHLPDAVGVGVNGTADPFTTSVTFERRPCAAQPIGARAGQVVRSNRSRWSWSACASARESVSKSFTSRMSRLVSFSIEARCRSRAVRSSTAPSRRVFDQALDGRERRAQFVADVRDQIGARLEHSLHVAAHRAKRACQVAQLAGDFVSTGVVEIALRQRLAARVNSRTGRAMGAPASARPAPKARATRPRR